MQKVLGDPVKGLFNPGRVTTHRLGTNDVEEVPKIHERRNLQVVTRLKCEQK